VGDGIDVVFVLDEGTDAEGAWPLSRYPPADAVRDVVIDDLSGMACDIDEWWPVFCEILDQAEQALQVAASCRGNDLKADEWPCGLSEVLSDSHRP
jgi:hypothetical protein